jgi:multidrug efflux pump subunit AcrA (membrane-fusion protein)
VYATQPAASPGRKLAPPNASPPPHGAQALSDPLGHSNPQAPTVEADLAPPEPMRVEASVQVDSSAFVPQGNSIEVDPELARESEGAFAASGGDAPPSERNPSADPAAQTPIEALFDGGPEGHSREVMVLAGSPVEPAPKKRRGLTILAVLVTLLAVSMAIPVPRQIEAACKVAPVVLAEPKAQVDGKVAELVVKSGDVVAAGTVLIRLTVADPPEAKVLADREAELKAKAEKIRLAAKGSAKAKKANTALARADKELTKAKVAFAKLEARKGGADKKAKKALDAKQKARDKAQAAADVENGARKIAELEAQAQAAAEERAKLLQDASGMTLTAPVAGRFEAPVKHALGMGLVAGEKYGRIVDPGLWKVTASELPAGTEPSTAKLELESGRVVDLTSATLSEEGATRTLEGNALLTDDASSAGRTVLKVRAGKRPLGAVLAQSVKQLAN